ncbi:hypothetical protein QYE76_061920 [Lolium multiflorum]|uniref:FBD domain-containing protein n=1 Tax=Lolium multiflorum TaxID=4521 RepID=A0AAD8S498_LOLMU|nr:hypothetical protein QYE76_061920 [Lolium multiflorum]
MATTASKRPIDGNGDQPSVPASGDQADLISELPDEVLGTVVSLLPTREGARTQELSRRWRPVWRAAPLNLDNRDGCGFSAKIVSSILSDHIGPARRISLTGFQPVPLPQDLACLQELELTYYYNPGRFVLPPSVFRLAPALRVARFGCCRLPPNLTVDLPQLQQLTLHGVALTEESFRALLSGCPRLESLLLEMNVGVVCLRVSSPSLRSIGFIAPPSSTNVVYELVVEDAPRLDRLVPLRMKTGPANIRVIRAPKLAILGPLSYPILQPQFGTTVFERSIAVSLATIMPTLKVFALDYVGPNLDVVLDFLKCFPCLESLYIKLQEPDPRKRMKDVRKYASLGDPTECLELHLKKVALKHYCGRGLEAGIARFFVLNAKVLERMEFGLDEDYGDIWMANQKLRLQLEDRASRCARFEFKRHSWSTLHGHKERTHDLSTSDPFAASFLDGYVTL